MYKTAQKHFFLINYITVRKTENYYETGEKKMVWCPADLYNME